MPILTGLQMKTLESHRQVISLTSLTDQMDN
uniref:Uncharacterized protein n=1 Tax=Moniliophthora roreri TaxID=221103 RepID=A0A0W0G130_MONRR